MYKIIIWFTALGLTLIVLQACAEPSCETDNQALQAMPAIEVVITREDGSEVLLNGKLADNDATRAAGFQRVCESTIKSSPILFDFQREIMPRFHMNNVVAPIDIAFIDINGQIESVHKMKPYVLGSTEKPLYGSQRAIVAALEVHEGFFDEHNVDLSSSLTWRLAAP